MTDSSARSGKIPISIGPSRGKEATNSKEICWAPGLGQSPNGKPENPRCSLAPLVQIFRLSSLVHVEFSLDLVPYCIPHSDSSAKYLKVLVHSK